MEMFQRFNVVIKIACFVDFDNILQFSTQGFRWERDRR